jgi:hypothetical protein
MRNGPFKSFSSVVVMASSSRCSAPEARAQASAKILDT